MLTGLVARDDDRVVLTLRGRLLANEVACRLRAPARVGLGGAGAIAPDLARATVSRN
jgi:hypothetical protein